MRNDERSGAKTRGSGTRWGPLLLAAALLAASGPTAAAEREARPFERGSWRLAFSGGMAFAIDRLGEARDVDDVRYAVLLPALGLALTGPLAREAWYRGNIELVGEGSFLFQTRPSAGGAAGGSLLLRYNWLRDGRLVPFLTLGGGMLDLDFDLGSQRDGFNFLLQGGLGTHLLLGSRAALSAEWRYQHVSNARTRLPNAGTNAGGFLLGTSFFFD